MKNRAALCTALILSATALTACEEDKSEPVKPEPTAKKRQATTADEITAPGPCKASKTEPTKLTSLLGDAFAIRSDGPFVYYSTWQVYESRGDVGKARKDGEGRQNLVSLELEPRGLDLSEDKVFYTEGIRLRTVSKEGGTAMMPAEVFPSQSIAVWGKFVYGVPGDYGPYDRLARQPIAGGTVEELYHAPRPKKDDHAVGYSSVAIDGTGIYVTDSGNGQLLRFGPWKGKPNVIAAKQKGVLNLALAESTVYLTRDSDHKLLSLPKKGGKKPKELSENLADDAPVAGNDQVVYSVLKPAAEGQPQRLVRIDPKSATPEIVTVIPADHAVRKLQIDDKCVYWTQRLDAGKSELYAIAR